MIVFILAWRLSASTHRYLQTYAPTNIAIAWFRTRCGLKWAIPVALVAMPLYAWAADAMANVLDRGGRTWLGFVAMLCVWNAIKFAINAVLTPLAVARLRLRATNLEA